MFKHLHTEIYSILITTVNCSVLGVG